MKKILLLSILSLVSVGFVQPYTVTKNIDEEKVVGFEEYASDELNKYAVNLSNKNSVENSESTNLLVKKEGFFSRLFKKLFGRSKR